MKKISMYRSVITDEEIEKFRDDSIKGCPYNEQENSSENFHQKVKSNFAKIKVKTPQRRVQKCAKSFIKSIK